MYKYRSQKIFKHLFKSKTQMTEIHWQNAALSGVRSQCDHRSSTPSNKKIYHSESHRNWMKLHYMNKNMFSMAWFITLIHVKYHGRLRLSEIIIHHPPIEHLLLSLISGPCFLIWNLVVHKLSISTSELSENSTKI